MGPKILINGHRGPQGVPDGTHGLVREGQLLPVPGKVPLNLGRPGGQFPHKVGPVVNEQGPRPGHGLVEVLQHLQQAGILLPIPKNPGLVVQQLVVLGQCLPISGAKLADGVVQKGPPLRRPRFNQRQILRAEQHRLDNPRQLRRGFQLHMVHQKLPPAPPGQLGLNEKGPVPAVHLGCDGPLIPLKGDELPVPSGPVGPGPGEKANGLQQIGLSLGILSPDHIDPRVKGSGKVGVVAKSVQADGADPHCTVSSRPAKATRSPGRSFFPRIRQTWPFTDT